MRVATPKPTDQHVSSQFARLAFMFYDQVHRLRLWLWRRQERMLERTHRLRGADGSTSVPNVSATAGANAGAYAGAFSGYATTNINATTCTDSGTSCSSNSDGGSSGSGGY